MTSREYEKSSIVNSTTNTGFEDAIKIRSYTGYGDDTESSGNTLLMMQSISGTLGPITYFVGSKDADKLTLNIS